MSIRYCSRSVLDFTSWFFAIVPSLSYNEASGDHLNTARKRNSRRILPVSPLGEAIYPILAKRVGLTNPLVTYDELVKSLPPLDPPYNDITRNDKRLSRALGEVGRACHDHGLPTVTALVIRSMEQSPGLGYYRMFHQETGDDPVRQREAWEKELGRLKTAKYPSLLEKGSPAEAHDTSDDHHKSHLLGTLRIADDAQKPTTVFTGHITCPHCSRSIDIEIDRNPKAVLAKQPAFVINEIGTSSRGKPLGHLFIGTILTSPVLYYGAVNHCGHEQRITLFFNRALRNRSDHHLTINESTSGQPDASSANDGGFSLS